ncbi:MAG: LacI family DNA-binding transcriptional regulator [Sphaerochaeta sp.]|uniref:LacI family DNA-binding transcriptional regulator n=1 Tax=Sphaerochaeta sp. TaxID=1972642 RepID=UPI002FC873B3
MKITRDTVAAAAQVSSATVSRVYNDPDSVSPELRKRVYRAAEELGYVPNSMAATLRRNGTGTIAFVEFAKEKRPYYWGNLSSFDWFFGRALRGVQQAIAQSSYQLRFYTIHDKASLLDIPKQCDGILAYDVDTPEEQALFHAVNIPYVLAHHLKAEGSIACVCTDNRAGGVLQAEYLKQQHCNSPLYLTGYCESVQPHRERTEGFLSLFPDAKVITTNIGRSDAIECILKEVQDLAENRAFDGIAAVNDLTLFSLLMRLGKRYPAVGYDASPFFTLSPHTFASVDIQSGALYKQAALKLLGLLKGKEPDSQTVLPRLLTPDQIDQ